MMALPFDPWTSRFIYILSEVFIFLILALDLRLLGQRKLRLTIWVSPVISIYVLSSIFLSIFITLTALSFEALTSYGVFFLSALAGMAVGLMIGNRIQVTSGQDGAIMFLGGRGLVALLWVLLLPRAVQQAAILLSSVATMDILTNIANGTMYPFDLLNIVTGALVVFGVFVSIGWRWKVQRRGSEMRSRTKPTPPQARKRTA
jgi:hypothetical protein